MSSELLLLRHAKSDWNSQARSDALRPLTPRGRRAAPQMGAFIARNNWLPDRVLCSPAVRTRQTLDGLAQELPCPLPTIWEESIYAASLQALLSCLKEQWHPGERLLLVGHNPGLEELLCYALPRTEWPAGPKRMPTCALARLEWAPAQLDHAGSAALLHWQPVKALRTP